MTLFPSGRPLGLLVLGLGVLAASPRPTPTPEPRLTGGFGRAPAAGAPASSTSRRREPVKITNRSLVTEPDKGNLSTSDARPSPTPAPAKTTATSGTTPTAAPAAPAEGEAYWRGEGTRLRERVAALKETITRLQSEVEKLEADFYSWDDGSYRDGVIKPAWDKAREELITARRELPIAEKDLADLPERARKAGAQPGWLRE